MPKSWRAKHMIGPESRTVKIMYEWEYPPIVFDPVVQLLADFGPMHGAWMLGITRHTVVSALLHAGVEPRDVIYQKRWRERRHPAREWDGDDWAVYRAKTLAEYGFGVARIAAALRCDADDVVHLLAQANVTPHEGEAA